MRTRLTTVMIAGMLAFAPACKNERVIDLHKGIKNGVVLAETARGVMGTENVSQRNFEKKPMPPKPGVAETNVHKANVMKTTPQPVKEVQLPKRIKLRGKYIDEVAGPGELPFKGSL